MMDAPTARFDEAVASTHNLAVEVEVLENGISIASIKPNDGTITLDAQAGTRGSADLTFTADDTLMLTDASDLLAPHGNELRVWRGIEYSDGITEGVSLGVFGIHDADPEDTGAEFTIPVVAYDRAQRVSEAKFEDDYTLAAGALFTEAIEELVREAIPDVQIFFASTDATTPAVTAKRGEDRWEFVQGLAKAIGAELYFDHDGILILRPVPTAQGAAQIELVEGTGGLLLRVGKHWSREEIHNRVIVTGGGLDSNPITGIATDDNPNSPTYYYSKFGKKPYFYESDLITETVQATDAATGILQMMLGAEQQIDFGSIVDPRFRPSMIAQITREASGIDERHVLDNVTIPLVSDDSITGLTRKTEVLD